MDDPFDASRGTADFLGILNDNTFGFPLFGRSGFDMTEYAK
jgi:hypothetical protein